MNASQRRVHAHAWMVLGVLLLAMLAIAVVNRPRGVGPSSATSHHPQEP